MENQNPLLAYTRKSQPILNLSSQGRFWPPNTLEKHQNIEVFPLTGQDEMLLLNASGSLIGSILAEIISNCIPAINDVWSMPRIDLDAIMIAIRCVSYNSIMNVHFSCEKCEHAQTPTVDLYEISNEIQIPKYDLPHSFDGVKIWFKPLTFNETFQESADQTTKLSVLKKLSSEDLENNEKKALAVSSLTEITEINVRSLARSIRKVSINDEFEVDSYEYIKEWIHNSDRETFTNLKKSLDNCNSEYALPQRTFACEKCNHKNTIDIDFNPADFLKKGD